MRGLLILSGKKLNSERSELAQRVNYMVVICNDKAEGFKQAVSEIYSKA